MNIPRAENIIKLMETFPYHIRPIDISKDAAEIAVLIRTGFRPWLDHGNLEYLNNLEKAGNDAKKNPFWTNLTGFPYSMSGVVCTDTSGTVIGTVSTSLFYLHERKCCLLTNVCVAPSHRKQGIASHMIEKIARLQSDAGTYGLYLQTRMAGTGLKDFYRKQGFSATDFRETWILPENKSIKPSSDIHIEHVPESDSTLFRRMFEHRYPETVLWNLDYPEDLFQPGKIPDLLNRLFSSGRRFLRAIDSGSRTVTWAAFQNMNEGADVLWFIPNEDMPDTSLSDALCSICADYKGRRALKADVPAGISGKIFQQTGFARQQTLAWMWRRL